MMPHHRPDLTGQALVEYARQRGAAFSADLFAAVSMLEQWPGEPSPAIREQAARALLHSFLEPALPVAADALTLFSGDARDGLLGGLIDDLAHGAALIVETAQQKGGAHD